jgi:PAS domain-containing protein
MVLSDPESGRVIAASEAALALFGYTKDEMLALTASDLRDANGRACAKNGAILDIDLTPTNIVLDIRSRRAA